MTDLLVPPSLAAIAHRSFERAVRDGAQLARERRLGATHPVSPHRAAYHRLPAPTLLGDDSVRAEVAAAYGRTGSLDLIRFILVGHAGSVSRRRAALTPREVALLADWRAEVVEHDLLVTEEAAAAGHLRYLPAAVSA